jgi:hypothetical protein
MIQCPACCSTDIKKNGFTHYGKQNHKCRNCNRQFVLDSQIVTDEKRTLVKRLLLERISLRGICRVLEISMSWLMKFVSAFYESLDDDLHVAWPEEARPEGGRILVRCFTCEVDEQWSFVGSKANQAWLWVAFDLETRQVVSTWAHAKTVRRCTSGSSFRNATGFRRRCTLMVCLPTSV